MKQCPKCKGLGKIETGRKIYSSIIHRNICQHCKGTGKIKVIK